MENYLQGNNIHPYHISVGAVVYNKEKKILCHYFGNEPQVGYFKENNLKNFYILMRETMEPNETLEQTLSRGLKEEFGATGKIDTYVGSIKAFFVHKGVKVEKTTTYFLVKCHEQNDEERGGDEESTSELRWMTIDELIPLMKEQTVRFGRTDLNESSILEKVRNLI